jgi:hypothetical protein
MEIDTMHMNHINPVSGYSLLNGCPLMCVHPGLPLGIQRPRWNGHPDQLALNPGIRSSDDKGLVTIDRKRAVESGQDLFGATRGIPADRRHGIGNA